MAVAGQGSRRGEPQARDAARGGAARDGREERPAVAPAQIDARGDAGEGVGASARGGGAREGSIGGRRAGEARG